MHNTKMYDLRLYAEYKKSQQILFLDSVFLEQKKAAGLTLVDRRRNAQTLGLQFLLQPVPVNTLVLDWTCIGLNDMKIQASFHFFAL